MSEKEKFNELFMADEQNYQYESITVLKKRLILASDFDIDNIILADDDPKAFSKKATMMHGGQTIVEVKDGFKQQQTQAPNKEALKKQQTVMAKEPILEERENPNERSVEVLSDSSEEEGAKPVDPKVKEEREKVARKLANTKAGNHDTSNEKPMDVFKNMFTEFKPFIPSKDSKVKEEAPKKKQGFFSTARNFFGL